MEYHVDGVCLQAYPRNYTSDRLQIFVHVTYGRGSVLWRRCNTLLGFVDYAMLAHNEPRGGMSIPLQRVTSLHRRAQANAPAASCLRRVLDDGGCRG